MVINVSSQITEADHCTGLEIFDIKMIIYDTALFFDLVFSNWFFRTMSVPKRWDSVLRADFFLIIKAEFPLFNGIQMK